MKIFTFDTTLRDGTQGESISFSVDDKLIIAQKLDELGIDYIEGGWPGSNPKDKEFFARATELQLHHSRLTAFGSTRFAKNPVEEDRNVRALVEAGTPVVSIFGKSWDFHVQRALGRVQVAGRNGPGRGWEPADRRGEVLFVPASVPRELMQVAVGTDEGDDLPEAGVVGEADRHAVGQHRAAGGPGQVVVMEPAGRAFPQLMNMPIRAGIDDVVGLLRGEPVGGGRQVSQRKLYNPSARTCTPTDMPFASVSALNTSVITLNSKIR